MPAEIHEEPQIENYVIIDPHGRDRHEYLFGRLVALEESIRNQAAKRVVGGGSSAHLACSNPAAWYSEFNRKIGHYEEKLRFGTKSTQLVEDIVRQLSDMEFVTRTTPLNAAAKAALLHGYRQQKTFNRAHSRWRHQQWARKKAKPAEADGTPTIEAAE